MRKGKAIPYPKGFERKFSNALGKMIEAMVSQYENETLNKLRKKDKEQFEDANFANVFKRLDSKARKKILKRFSNRRISKMVTKILSNLTTVTSKQFEESIPAISTQEIIAQGEINFTAKALQEETASWAIKLRDDTLSEWTANTMRNMVLGKPFEEIVGEYKAQGKQRKNHAEFVARNQLGTYTTLLNKKRYERLGIKKAEWVTNMDGRERPSHGERNGKIFVISEGLGSKLDDKVLLPAIDYDCRCTMIPIFDEDF